MLKNQPTWYNQAVEAVALKQLREQAAALPHCKRCGKTLNADDILEYCIDCIDEMWENYELRQIGA